MNCSQAGAVLRSCGKKRDVSDFILPTQKRVTPIPTQKRITPIMMPPIKKPTPQAQPEGMPKFTGEENYWKKVAEMEKYYLEMEKQGLGSSELTLP